MQDAVEMIGSELLEQVTGGLPNGPVARPVVPRPEPFSGNERFDRYLNERGFDATGPDLMPRPPRNPNMDPGLERQPRETAPPRGQEV